MSADLIARLDEALHDVPIHPTAWVPLHFATVIALRSELGRLQALDGLFDAISAVADRYQSSRRPAAPPPSTPDQPPPQPEGQTTMPAEVGTQMTAAIGMMRAVATYFDPIYPVTPADEVDYPPAPTSTPDQPPPQPGEGRGGVDDAFRQRCIAELRRLATNGTVCSQREWDLLRHQDLPDVDGMLASLRMSWNELVAAAGLRRASGRRQVRAVAADTIDAHIAAGAEPVDDSERYAVRLEASSARTTVHHGKLPTGEPVQVTATHYMLR